MAASSLPEEGELRLGSILLPAGKRVHACHDPVTPVAWVTRQAVPDAGRVWAALSAAHRATGLVPFLLGSLAWDPARPWDTGEFSSPADPARLDGIDAAELLGDMWEEKMPSAEEEDEDQDGGWAAMRAPFSRQFPGLAPVGSAALSPEQLGQALGSLPAARIGLVRAARSADVLPLIGWTPSDQSDALPVGITASLMQTPIWTFWWD